MKKKIILLMVSLLSVSLVACKNPFSSTLTGEEFTDILTTDFKMYDALESKSVEEWQKQVNEELEEYFDDLDVKTIAVELLKVTDLAAVASLEDFTNLNNDLENEQEFTGALLIKTANDEDAEYLVKCMDYMALELSILNEEEHADFIYTNDEIEDGYRELIVARESPYEGGACIKVILQDNTIVVVGYAGNNMTSSYAEEQVDEILEAIEL